MELMKAKEFIKMYGLEMDCVPIQRRSDGLMSEHPMDHWRVIITEPGGRDTAFYYSQGKAFNGEPPEFERVLESIAMDMVVDTSVPFEIWADEMGLDPDSRKHERIYKAVKQLQRDFKTLLGDAGAKDLKSIEEEL